MRAIKRLYTTVWLLPAVFSGVGPQRGNSRSGAGNMVNDPISDMLTRIRNGYLVKNQTVSLPWSKLKENLAEILVKSGYLLEKTKEERDLVLKLKYNGKVPAVTNIKRISKPSLRIYAGKNKLPKVLGGAGISIISTPQGLMTNKEAYKKNLGGEVICEVF